jgi:hypothetical protein
MNADFRRFEMDGDEIAEHEAWTAQRRELMGESWD